MECCGRPNRSDVHLSQEEAARIEEETRDYFDGIAPKRHAKPSRSEHSSQYVDPPSDRQQEDIPEFLKFQHLENDPQKLVYSGSEVTEEFVETEYYQDLNCIDKQHHTTGTGFIKMENADGKSFNLAANSATCCQASCKGNPATNDWIPAAADKEAFSSDKPNRSENWEGEPGGVMEN